MRVKGIDAYSSSETDWADLHTESSRQQMTFNPADVAVEPIRLMAVSTSTSGFPYQFLLI
jgi:hypothetical protein